jgi:hypothetical protein
MVCVNATGSYLGGGIFELARGEVEQSFEISGMKPLVKFITLHVLSNYGNEEYTCIYDFSVSGYPLL